VLPSHRLIDRTLFALAARGIVLYAPTILYSHKHTLANQPRLFTQLPYCMHSLGPRCAQSGTEKEGDQLARLRLCSSEDRKNRLGSAEPCMDPCALLSGKYQATVPTRTSVEKQPEQQRRLHRASRLKLYHERDDSDGFECSNRLCHRAWCIVSCSHVPGCIQYPHTLLVARVVSPSCWSRVEV